MTERRRRFSTARFAATAEEIAKRLNGLYDTTKLIPDLNDIVASYAHEIERTHPPLPEQNLKTVID